MTDRILYPSKVEPLPENAGNNLAKWYQPPSEPQMNNLKKYAVVMAAASGMVFNPLPIPNPVPDIISVQLTDQFRKISTQTAPWQRAEFFDPLPIPTPPNVAMWQPWTNIPVRLPVGLKAPWQAFEFFVDIQPFINPADSDVFVKYYPQEKDRRKQRDEEWEGEQDWKNARREAIAKAVFAGDLVEIEWTGRPAKAATTPQTAGLSRDIFQAQTKIRTLQEIAAEEEEERQLEKLLLDL